MDEEHWQGIPIKIQNSAALLKTGLSFELEVKPLEPCAQTESESLFFGLKTSCPKGYSTSPTKKCYKFFEEALTWQGASYSCQADRGSIATGFSNEDASFVFDLAGQPEDLLYWASGEPNGETDDVYHENCAVIDDSGTRSDVHCGNSHWFVCQKNPVSAESQLPVSHSGQSWKNAAAAKTRNLDIATPDAVCRLGYLKSPDGSWCYRFVSTPATWRDAIDTCQEDDAWLATIHDLQENNFVTDWAAPRSVWIGLNDRHEENSWVWTHPDGGDFEGDYRHWAPGEPGAEHCVQIFGKQSGYEVGGWDDANCYDEIAFFCQTAMQQSDISSTELSSASQWYPGFSLVCNKNSWSKADQFNHTIRVQFGSTQILPRTAVFPVGEYSQVRLELRVSDMQEQDDGNGASSLILNLIVAGGTSLFRHKLDQKESREFFLTLQSEAFPNSKLTVRNLLIAPIDIPRTFALTNKFSEFTLTQDNLVGVVALPSSYTVSFDLYPTVDGTDYRSILHLTANGADTGLGACLPGVWFCQGLGDCPSLALHVVHMASDRIVMNTAQALPLNAWSTILITIDSVNLLMTLAVTRGVTIPTMSVAFPRST